MGSCRPWSVGSWRAVKGWLLDGDLSYVVVSQRVRRLTGLVVSLIRIRSRKSAPVIERRIECRVEAGMSAGLRIDAAKQNDELHPHNTGA
jgi:hypothetical protein